MRNSITCQNVFTQKGWRPMTWGSRDKWVKTAHVLWAITPKVDISHLGGCFGCYSRFAALRIAANKFLNISLNLQLDTHHLLLLPRLHRRLVLLKLMAPVWVDFLVVVAFGRRRASVSIDSHIIRTQKRRSHPAIVSSSVSFCYRNYHQPCKEPISA